MDVEDLRLLDAVAAEGSFSRAAARLRFSQPSVSARIAAVERAVGADLFVRDSRGARLTPAGQRYLHYVRRCLYLLEQGRHAAAQRAEQVIRVGVPASYAPALAPVLADAAIAQQLPLSIRTGHSAGLREELLDGHLDLAFTAPGPVAPGITSRPAAESAIAALACPPGQGARRDQAPGQRFAVHSWSQDADEVIAEMLAADTSGGRIIIVSPHGEPPSRPRPLPRPRGQPRPERPSRPATARRSARAAAWAASRLPRIRRTRSHSTPSRPPGRTRCPRWSPRCRAGSARRRGG